MRGVRRSLLVLALLAPGWPGSAAEPSPAEAAQLRETMHQVFDSLAVVLPLSLDDERFASPEERAKIQAALDALAKQAREIDAHTGQRDAGFGGIADSLSRDIADAQRHFARRHYPEAQFALSQLTSNCVACHSRLPKARDFPLAAKLTELPEVKSLDPVEQIRLLVATRQFGAALDLCEKRFADPSLRPVDLDMDDTLLTYLLVSVRVERNLPRARATLAKFAARKEVPLYLSLDLNAWLLQLDELAAAEKAEPSIARARTLIDKGRDLSQFPADRIALVYDLGASSELMRWVATPGRPKPELAEAYFLLGATTARIERADWVTEIEQDLETSIRLDPSGPYARTAYALLEEYTFEVFGGSEGVNVPPDVEDRLRELKTLIGRKPK